MAKSDLGLKEGNRIRGEAGGARPGQGSAEALHETMLQMQAGQTKRLETNFRSK